jgi:hypothetical protein
MPGMSTVLFKLISAASVGLSTSAKVRGNIMRTVLSSTVAACAAALLLAPTAASAATQSHLKIVHGTGAIYQYDPSILGTGPTYDTVTVSVQLRGCPPATTCSS